MMSRPGTRLPLLVVLLSLLSLVLVPALIQRKTEALHREIDDVADPARVHLAEIQRALALEVAGTRGYLLTGEARYAERFRLARERRERAYAQFVPLARRMGGHIAAGADSLGARLGTADAQLDQLFSGRVSREEYLRHLAEQQDRLQATAATTARLDDAVRGVDEALRGEIRSTSELGTLLTVLAASLALLGALLVARLGSDYRVLSERLDVRAREQSALREISGELSATTSFDEAARTVAARALETTRASGVHVERLDAPDPGGVEVAAGAGAGIPPPGTRLPLPGSLAAAADGEEVLRIATGTPGAGERAAPYLGEWCPDCTGMAVPLLAGERALGALVLLRGRDAGRFTPAEADFARALGDLASSALERVLLLEELRERDERFRQIAENIREFVWLGDPVRPSWMYVSPAYEIIWGRSRESLYEDPSSFLEGVHPEDRERAEAALSGLGTGEYSAEYRVVRPDGEVRWVRSRGLPVRNERGEVYRIAGITEDFTERKRIEEERERLVARERAARKRATTILESISDAFFAVDHDWRFTYVNQRAGELMKAMTQAEPGQLLGRSLWDVIPESRGTRFEEMHRRAVAEREPVHFEEYFAPWDRWFEVHDFPSEDGLSIYFQDVTDRKHLEEERERLRLETEHRHAELEQVMESRARLIRGFSHDVKNPLGAADGYAALLEQGIMGELSQEQRQSVERIRSSLDSSLRLIQDLLELAQAEAGQIEVRRVPTDVSVAAREVADDFRAQAVGAGLSLEVRTPGRSLVADTDPTRVRQVLGNLVSNAVKYGGEGTITVAADARDGDGAPGPGSWIAVDVRDTGPGIPVEKQEQVFREFTRLDPGARHGAGIGLAISRRIARLMGGEVTLVSEPGKGSTFTLWLPADGPAGGGQAEAGAPSASPR